MGDPIPGQAALREWGHAHRNGIGFGFPRQNPLHLLQAIVDLFGDVGETKSCPLCYCNDLLPARFCWAMQTNAKHSNETAKADAPWSWRDGRGNTSPFACRPEGCMCCNLVMWSPLPDVLDLKRCSLIPNFLKIKQWLWEWTPLPNNVVRGFNSPTRPKQFFQIVFHLDETLLLQKGMASSRRWSTIPLQPLGTAQSCTAWCELSAFG